MAVDLQVNIMAHESRAHLYEPLLASMPEDTNVYVDDGTLGRWGNGRRCLLNYSKGVTHVLVIQDDALPARDLVAGIAAHLEHLPPSILCLYSGKLAAWRRIYERHAKPPCFLQMTDIQWGVALVVPTEYIPGLVKRGDMLTRIGNYDMRLSESNKRMNKLPVLYPAVSWVQHAYTPSTVPGRKPNRFALECLTEDQSVLDWGTPGEVPIVRVPDFTRRGALR